MNARDAVRFMSLLGASVLFLSAIIETILILFSDIVVPSWVMVAMELVVAVLCLSIWKMVTGEIDRSQPIGAQ